MDIDFPALLRNYRKSMGWTQEEMADNWSYSFETISAWERGRRKPRNQEIPRLAKFLGISAEELAQIILSSHDQSYLPTNNSTLLYEMQTEWKSSFEMWGELQFIYRTRTEFNSDFSYARLFENAHSILATGIGLGAIALHYSRTALVKSILKDDCTVQLCFLDPKGKKCVEREQEEGYPQGTLADDTNVNIYRMKTVRNQIEKISLESSKRLKILVYDLTVRFNIYIVDGILMTVQSYGYGRGEDTPILLLKRKVSGGLFDFYASVAKHILDHSIDISRSASTGK